MRTALLTLVLLGCATPPSSDTGAPDDTGTPDDTSAPDDTHSDDTSSSDTHSDDTDTAPVSAWSTTRVHADPARHTTMTLHDGEVHVAWMRDRTNDTLWIAARDGASWTTEEVDGETLSGAHGHLVSHDGDLHIAYASFGDLTVSSGGLGDWTRTSIRPGARGQTSIVFEGDDPLYAHTNTIKGFQLTWGDGQPFDNIESSSSGASTEGVLLLDAAGTRHVALDEGDFYKLLHGTWDGDAWQLAAVADYPSAVSMVLDGLDPIIAFHQWWDKAIHVLVPDEDGFDERVIEAGVGSLSTGTAVALDGQGRIHVVWHSAVDGGVSWAVEDGSGWQVEEVGETGNGGGYPSLLIDGDTVVVAYGDPSGLYVATRELP